MKIVNNNKLTVGGAAVIAGIALLTVAAANFAKNKSETVAKIIDRK